MVTQDKPGRGDSRVLMWLGHYSVYLMLVALAAALFAEATGTRILPDLVSDLAWIAWMVSVFADWYYHESRLCERCIAATPLDTQAAVDRWRPVLWWNHQPGWRFTTLGASVAVSLWIAGQAHLAWWAWVLVVAGLSSYGFFFLSSLLHRRLYPWCPYCRWDDGGDEEVPPDVPAPEMSK